MPGVVGGRYRRFNEDTAMHRASHCRTNGVFFVLGVLSGLSCGCARQVEHAVISPDGKYFAQSTSFGTTIHEIESGKKVKELQGAAASNLTFSADSKYLASGKLSELTLWNWAEGEPLASWKGHNRHSFKMAFSRDGLLLAARDDRSLRVWETRKQRLVLTISLPFEMDSLAFSPDGKVLAVAGTEAKEKEPRFHEIKLWQVPSGKALGTLQGPEYCMVQSLQFSPDGRFVATGLSIQASRLWDARARKEVWKQEVGNVDYDILTFSSDGKQLAVGGYESVCVLDAAKGTMIKKLELPGSPITSLTAVAQPARLVVAKRDSVHAIDLDSWKQQQLFPK
jgi:WD40 repeat protein